MGSKTNLFTKILYILTIVGTALSLVIVYNDSSSEIAHQFLMEYVLFILFMLIYTPVLTFINMRKLSWIEARKPIIKFIWLFTLFSAFNYSVDFLFKSVRTVSFHDFSTAFGVAFGISFFNVIFLKKPNKKGTCRTR